MLRDIINTYRQAFRLYVRHRTRPLSLEEAEEKRLFWSKWYLTIAFGSLIVATYITKKEDINFEFRKQVNKDQAALDALVRSPKHVVKYRNFQKVGEFDYTPTVEDNKTDHSLLKNE